MSEQSRFLDRHTPPHITTLVIVTGAGALNMNVVLPSLPGIATHFGVSYSYVQLLISAYLAATAAMQLIIGPLSDRFGRRPVMLTCVGIFLVATLVCIFAPNFQTMLAARLVQTVIIAGLVLSRAVVRDMHEPARAASLFGYITMGMAVVPMIGPAIGGVLEEIFGWQAAFSVTLVFGIVVFGMVMADMGETNKYPSANFAAQFRSYPELIRSRRFWGYALSAAFTSGSFFAYLGGAPYVSVTHLGLSPSELGFYFALTAVGYMAGNFLSGRYTERFGINTMLLSGNLISALGMIGSILTFAAGSNHPLAFFGYMIFIGLGNGISLPSANAGIVSVRPHLAGSAAGLGGALMIGGGAALSVLSGAVLSPQSGAYPILYIMLISSIAGALMALYVMHVARQVALETREPVSR